MACPAETALCFLTWSLPRNSGSRSSTSRSARSSREIQEERPEIAKLVDSPRRLLAFRTFAYIRVGILLGRLLVENDVEPDEGATWAEQLAHSPEHRDEVVQEVLAVAEEVAADPAYADEQLGPSDEERERFSEFAKRRLASALEKPSRRRRFADNAGTVGKRLTIFVALAGLLVLLTGAGGAGGAGSTAGASARAVAIRVVVPGQAGAEAGSISSPPYHAAFGSAFAYPTDGSVVSTGSDQRLGLERLRHLRNRRRDERGADAQPLRRRDHGRPRSRAPRTARPRAAPRGATSPARRSPR